MITWILLTNCKKLTIFYLKKIKKCIFIKILFLSLCSHWSKTYNKKKLFMGMNNWVLSKGNSLHNMSKILQGSGLSSKYLEIHSGEIWISGEIYVEIYSEKEVHNPSLPDVGISCLLFFCLVSMIPWNMFHKIYFEISFTESS